MSLKDKTLFITGATRGIGLAIGMRAAADGANIVVIGKTDEPHPKLPGTIHTAAKEIEEAGGKALAIKCDIRFDDQVSAAMDAAVSKFGGIDILMNNASAISLTGINQTDMKRYDLMQQINTRGTYLCSKLALPHLVQAKNPHILTMSPPLNLAPRWFKHHCAYTIAKYGMSMCTLGLAEELRAQGVAVNSLLPETAIDTAAVRNLLSDSFGTAGCRKPSIVADAAYWILTQPAGQCTGNFFIDAQVLSHAGVTDLDQYAVTPGQALAPDFFL